MERARRVSVSVQEMVGKGQELDSDEDDPFNDVLGQVRDSSICFPWIGSWEIREN